MDLVVVGRDLLTGILVMLTGAGQDDLQFGLKS
jgi:hypothetical protein